MAWTTPVDQVTGFLVTAAVYNTQIIDNLAYLHGDAGMISLTGLLKDASGLTTGPTSAVYTGTQTAGGFVDVTGQFASICNAAVIAFAAGAVGDTIVRWSCDSNGNMAWGPGGAAATDLSITRKGGALLKISGSGASARGNIMGGSTSSAPGLPATFTPEASSLVNRCAPINNSGALTIAAPNSAPTGSESAFFYLIVAASASGITTITWNGVFIGFLPASLAASVGFALIVCWDPGTSKWISLSTTGSIAGL